MSEINIKLKSFTGNSLDLNINIKGRPQELYGRVYWKIMGYKFRYVEYEKATGERLSELNTELRGEGHSLWEAERDNDGDVVYVYRPKQYWLQEDHLNAKWTEKSPPTEYADDGPEKAKSYSNPRDMQDYRNLVLLVRKPSEEKRLDYPSMSRGDYTTYTEQEFIKKFGEWKNGTGRPISIAQAEQGAPGRVIIPKRSFTEYLWGYLEEGSEVNYYFKAPHLRGGAGKRKSKRRKSKKRKSKRRKSKSRRRRSR